MGWEKWKTCNLQNVYRIVQICPKNQLTRRRRDVNITIVAWSGNTKKVKLEHHDKVKATQKTADKKEEFQRIPVAKFKVICYTKVPATKKQG